MKGTTIYTRPSFKRRVIGKLKRKREAVIYIFSGLILIIAVGMCERSALKEKEKPLSIIYETNWHTDFNKDITIALVANGVRGCGEYKYKAHLSSLNEYMVYCSPDGKNWQAYMVWPLIKKVMGPYQPNLGLN